VRFLLFVSLSLFASSVSAVEAFKIELHDRRIKVEAPSKVTGQYAVIVENLSLSDVAAKFHAAGKDLKFVNIKSGSSRTVEFKHAGKEAVFFRPLAPAFQEIELVAGKKVYEIPAKP